MHGMWTGVNPVYIYPASRMVSNHTGMMIQPHRAIVGANAFLHECGMHQDGESHSYVMLLSDCLDTYDA